MWQTLTEQIVEGLRETPQFAALPPGGLAVDALWTAYRNTLIRLRRPLYFRNLKKPEPKPAVYREAIEFGMALLGVFANVMGVTQLIIRFENGSARRMSPQPRPFGHDWNRGLLRPPDGQTLTEPLEMPVIEIIDALHLGRKVAIAFVHQQRAYEPHGTATFEFEPSYVRLVYHEYRQGLYDPNYRRFETVLEW